MARRPATPRAFKPFASQAAAPHSVGEPAPAPATVDPHALPVDAAPIVAPQPEAWELPAATTPIAKITAPLAPSVTQEAPLVAERTQTPLELPAVAEKAHDNETTLEVPLYEYTDDEPEAQAAPEPWSEAPADPETVMAQPDGIPSHEDEAAPPAYELPNPVYELPNYDASVYAAPNAYAPPYDAAPAEGPDAIDAGSEAAYRNHDEPEPTVDAASAIAPEPFSEPMIAGPSDDSDLPAFLRDDAPVAELPSIESYMPEPEHNVFVAPSSDPPMDSLVDEVDAAFIASGLPTQEMASPVALSTAEVLQSLARRLRTGDLPLHGAAAGASEAATLAAVLAALLADG